MMRRYVIAAIVLLTGGSWKPLAGSGQQPAPPQDTFRSGAQIVQVDVRVHKDGRFVADLGPADFAIKENGVPQKIESVVLIASTNAPAAPRAASSALRAAEDRPQAPPQVWIFVFDTDHLTA